MISSNFLFILVGFVAGVLSGLFGIGGGIVIVPIMIWFGHFSQLAANSISLTALLLPVGILAVLAYHKSKMVKVRQALFISLGIFIGVVGGAILALEIPAHFLKRLYGIFLLYIAWTYIDIPSLLANRDNQEKTNQQFENLNLDRPVCYIVLGFAAGIMSGLFGIGGGIIIVPALISIFKYPYKKAVGTSLMALLLPVGLPGVLIYNRAGQLQIGPALFIALGLLFGALVGALVAIELPTKLIKRIYGGFLLLAGFNFIF